MADDSPLPADTSEPVDVDMLAPGDGLTMVQSLFVRLTIEGKGLHEAAEACHKDVRTLYRWLKMPAIKDAIAQGTMAGLLRARSVLTSRAAHAADSLTRMCTDKGGSVMRPDQSRVAAAKAVLELAIKLGEYAGDAAPTKHEISGTAPITLRIVDPIETASQTPEQEHASGASGGDNGPAGDT